MQFVSHVHHYAFFLFFSPKFSVKQLTETFHTWKCVFIFQKMCMSQEQLSLIDSISWSNSQVYVEMERHHSDSEASEKKCSAEGAFNPTQSGLSPYGYTMSKLSKQYWASLSPLEAMSSTWSLENQRHLDHRILNGIALMVPITHWEQMTQQTTQLSSQK